VGRAVLEERLALDDTICTHLPTLPQSSCDLTVEQLLELSSGFDWLEAYEDRSYAESSVLAMLYGSGYPDAATFVANHPRRAEPGMSYVYSTGEVALLTAVVQGAMPASSRSSFPWTQLFDRLGMRDVTFERDPKGQFAGGSWVWTTPRDLARFGTLYLHDGCWDGRRLLPPSWVAATTSVNRAFLREAPYWDGGEVPGRLWWLNQPAEQGAELPWPDVPQGAYSAIGHWGQTVTVIPTHDMVVVRTADDRKDGFDLNTFLRLAMAVAQEP
jgi:CubicO group peptidase (beta-lactamase class C family)